jgi:hypothetical protein
MISRDVDIPQETEADTQREEPFVSGDVLLQTPRPLHSPSLSLQSKGIVYVHKVLEPIFRDRIGDVARERRVPASRHCARADGAETGRHRAAEQNSSEDEEEIVLYDRGKRIRPKIENCEQMRTKCL